MNSSQDGIYQEVIPALSNIRVRQEFTVDEEKDDYIWAKFPPNLDIF